MEDKKRGCGQADCLAAGTMILMADGSSKPIEQVNLGDKVCTDTWRDGVVRNVTRGVEESLIRITTEGGKVLMTTPQHPIKTERGLVRAEKLRSDDRLLMSRAGEQIGERLRATEICEYHGIVYNIDLGDDGGVMICNGIYVGDMQKQNEWLVGDKDPL